MLREQRKLDQAIRSRRASNNGRYRLQHRRRCARSVIWRLHYTGQDALANIVPTEPTHSAVDIVIMYSIVFIVFLIINVKVNYITSNAISESS